VAFFSSSNNLVDGDSNNKDDVFIHDRQTGQTRLVSRNMSGQAGDNASYNPALSADGRYVAFQSHASDLVVGDNNDYEDVFVRDSGALWGSFELDIIQYLLSVNVVGSGSGSVSSDPAGISCATGGGDCEEPYGYGTVITLTASADTGSTFTGWSGACTNASGECVDTMTAAQFVTATFALDQHLLTVATDGNGSGTVTGTEISCPGDCDQTFDYGTVVTLTASADTGSTFTGWSGACTNTTGDCMVTMDAAKSVTATFTQDEYLIFLPLVLR